MTTDDTVTNTEQLEQQSPKKKLKLKKVKDQVIVITGATSGIGLVTARMAAEKGAKVVAAARNEDALQELVDEVKKKGHEAIYVKADVGKEEDVNRIAETAISTFGRFDTWVNNAAVSVFGHAMDVTTEDMKRVFDTNFWGPVYGTRAAVKHFTSRGGPGALINVGSLFGDRGTVIQSTYASAKFALHGWTESIRMELEKEQVPVSVTLIHPGRIDTPYNEHARSYLDKQPAHYRSMIYPPEAAAEAILFAAEHPKRDMYIGSQAKAIAMLGALFPRLTDRLMEKIMYYSQHAERPSKPREESALYHAGYGMHDRGTNKGWLRSRSYYAKATKRPAVTAAVAVGLACVWAAVKRTK
ncbi:MULTISPECIES: SDR family oxidoreductase [Bacillus]|uniref:SDR family oxidoreductase n=1 Tax=Bacillus TaxID=1386 RepID=UPI00084B8728|nr:MULTISPECIES: SDR family oxidoreductase [Bacillus]OEC78731.1 oxidoreductase [Bacillus halotolerans]UZD51452.1 SDR family oxidoreductase [Bacillus halotolerans]WEY45111.1 SDR family oxidoreductase [Bacillus sp. B28]